MEGEDFEYEEVQSEEEDVSDIVTPGLIINHESGKKHTFAQFD